MPHDVIVVHTQSTACAGSTPESAHPRVFLDLSKKHHAVCPYCSQRFIHEGHQDDAPSKDNSKTTVKGRKH
ncbi:MAG: zinc-finger domain-containing protein [Holosporales bacterium]